MAEKNKKKQKENEAGGSLGRKILFFMTRYLGKWSVKVVAYPIIMYFVIVRKHIRKILLNYWKGIRPGKPKIVYYLYICKHFYSFGMSLIDRIIAKDNPQYCQEKNQLNTDILKKQDKGTIILFSHIGGYNLHRLLDGVFGSKKILIVMYQSDEKSSFADNFQRQQVKFIAPDAEGVITEIAETLRESGFVIMMGDRIPPQNKRAFYIKINNIEYPISLGPFNIALTTETDVVCMFIIKKKDKYTVKAKKPIKLYETQFETRNEAILYGAETYAEYLKEITLAYPFQWYNFGADIKVVENKEGLY